MNKHKKSKNRKTGGWGGASQSGKKHWTHIANSFLCLVDRSEENSDIQNIDKHETTSMLFFFFSISDRKRLVTKASTLHTYTQTHRKRERRRRSNCNSHKNKQSFCVAPKSTYTINRKFITYKARQHQGMLQTQNWMKTWFNIQFQRNRLVVNNFLVFVALNNFNNFYRVLLMVFTNNFLLLSHPIFRLATQNLLCVGKFSKQRGETQNESTDK